MHSATIEDRRPPVAETQDGNDGFSPSGVSCTACGHRNPTTRKFCASCGKSLREPCPKCGAEGLAGETFCGTCGVNLKQLVVEQRQGLSAKLDEARGLLENLRFDEARSRLRSVAKLDEEPFRELAREAQGLLDDINSRQQQLERQIAEALNQANEMLARHEYELAAERLASLPELQRNEEVQATLQRARATAAEYRELQSQLAEAAERQKLLGLKAVIERLLEIKPDDELARRSGQRLRDGVMAAAKKKLAEHHYAHTLKLLEQTPEPFRDREVERLVEHARELQWLLTTVQSSAVVDRPLLAIAKHFIEVAPTNGEAVRLVEELRQRAKQPPAEHFHSAPDWSAPRSIRLGCPVHGLSGLKRIVAAPAAEAQLRAVPGRFFVAIGLALQALERAAVDINLGPTEAEPSGLWSKLSRRPKKTPPSAAWGLDIGDAAIKAVRLVAENSDAVTLETVEGIEHAKCLSQAISDGERRELIQGSLTALKQQHAMSDAPIFVGLPSHLALIRAFRLPPVPESRLVEAVRLEAQQQLPFALDELRWGSVVVPVLSAGESKPEIAGWDVIVEGVRDSRVEDVVRLCEQAGFTVHGVQSDCLALHNFIVYEHLANDKSWPATAAIATLDVGVSSSRLVISAPGSVWYRGLPTGGAAITSQLVQTYKLTYPQSEKLKRNPVAVKRVSRWHESIQPSVERLSADVERSFKQYGQSYPGVEVRQLFGVGGGFAVHGLLSQLRSAGE